MGTFSLSFNKFKNKSVKQMDAIIRKTALNLYGDIIVNSPVDTGRFRANNMISIDNEINYATLETDGTKKISDKRESSKYLKESEKFNDLKLGRFIYIQNNLVYAKDIEFGLYSKNSKSGKTSNGFSIQAPSGVYRIAIARFSKHLTDATRTQI